MHKPAIRDEVTLFHVTATLKMFTSLPQHGMCTCTTQRTLTLLCYLCLHIQVPQCYVILLISLCTVPPLGLFDDCEISRKDVNYNVEARLADTTVLSPVIRRRMPAANSHPV